LPAGMPPEMTTVLELELEPELGPKAPEMRFELELEPEPPIIPELKPELELELELELEPEPPMIPELKPELAPDLPPMVMSRLLVLPELAPDPPSMRMSTVLVIPELKPESPMMELEPPMAPEFTMVPELEPAPPLSPVIIALWKSFWWRSQAFQTSGPVHLAELSLVTVVQRLLKSPLVGTTSSISVVLTTVDPDTLPFLWSSTILVHHEGSHSVTTPFEFQLGPQLSSPVFFQVTFKS